MKYDPKSKLGLTEIELLMMPFNDTDAADLEPDWDAIDAVTSAMSLLTEEERWILYRIFYDRVTYEELTNNLGIKARSHAWRKTRLAMDKLKKILLENPRFQHMKDDNGEESESRRTQSNPRGAEKRSDKDGTTNG